MNFALVDESKVVIARSRDLDALKKQHGSEAVQNFEVLAQEELSFSGCRDWAFGELPERFRSGQVFGFPALVDEGEAVGLRVFDVIEAAAASQERGLVRLFRLAMSKELKYLRKNLPLTASVELAYRQLPAHPFLYSEFKAGRDLREDVLDRIMAALYLDGQPDIRSAAAFEKRLEEGRSEVVPVGNAAGKLVSDILSQAADVAAKLKSRPGPAAEDMRQQLARLVYAGFLATTPYPALKEFPRYLKALQYRMEKSAQDPGRDQKQVAELAPLWQKYWLEVEKVRDRNPPERDAFRWMLEELRVSLFGAIPENPLIRFRPSGWRRRGMPGTRPDKRGRSPRQCCLFCQTRMESSGL